MWCTPLTKRDLVLMVLLVSTCFMVVRFSAVRRLNCYTNSDSLGCLLVSQSLIQHGTIKLDAYGSFDALKAQYAHQVCSYNDHSYYYFPLGASLLAVPFVAFANICSFDMINQAHDKAVQSWLAVMTVCTMMVLVYTLSRFRLGSFQSTLFAVLFVFGSSMSSTCGTALWSFNCELIFILIALHCFLAISDEHARHTALSILLGFSLFIAYLCRPSALVFAVGCVSVLLLISRPSAWRTLIVLCVCFLVFAAFSVHEYGSVVPPYYQLSHLNTTRTFSTALLGNLLSPSRGLLVFSPFFAVILISGLFCHRHDFLFRSFAYGWLLLDIVAVSRLPHWWGGHSFGPRLLTDAVPAILFIGILTVPRLQGSWKNVFWSSLILLGALSVGIHPVQGLFNPATHKWNCYPNIDYFPRYIFDWRCPQFAVTSSLLDERMHRLLEVAAPKSEAGDGK